MILPKVGVGGFTGSRREIDIKREFGFEIIWKQMEIISAFFSGFPNNK